MVFRQPGALPAPMLDQLIDAVRGLDMDEVRQKVAAVQQDVSTLPRRVAELVQAARSCLRPYPGAAMARTYEVRTYGCQMNVHDSERLTGLLEEAGYVAAADGRPGRRGRVQHLRGARERRQQALRQPRPPGAGEGQAPGHADRRRRLPGPEGPRRDHPQGAVGRRRVRHPQHRLAAGAARARAGATRRRRSRSSSRSRSSRRRCRRGASRRTPPGSRSRSAATTPARSASSRPCAARRRTAGPATSSPRSARWSPRASARSPCWARTSTPTAWSSATGRRSASCCGPAARSRGWSGCASPARTRRSSPTT